MKILIIKNDGIGDLIINLSLIKSIKKSTKARVDLILNSKNFFLRKELKIFNNLYFLDFDNFSLFRNKPSNRDRKILEKISTNKYDKAILLRSIINDENLEVLDFINSKKKYYYGYVSNNSLKRNIEKAKNLDEWKKIKINDKHILEYSKTKSFLKKINLIKNSKINFFSSNKQNKNSLVLNLSGEKNVYKKTKS